MSNSISLKAKTLIVASAAITIVPFVPTESEAHRFNATSNITINRQGTRIFGKVASARAHCKRNRSVTLYRTRNGRRRVAQGTTTGWHGNYSFRIRSRGRFQAIVSQRAGGGYGHSHLCRGDRSPTIRKKRRG